MKAPIPEPHRRDTTLDLYFLATEKDMEVLAKMEDYSQQYWVFYNAFNERNSLIHDLQLSVQARAGEQATMEIEEIKKNAGRKLNSDLMTETDLIFQTTEYLTSEYPQLRLRLGTIFKRLFPNEPLILLDTLPALK